MLSVAGSAREKQREFARDRKKIVSQTDFRNIKPLDEKFSVGSPKFVNYAVSATQKNAPSKKLSFGLTSPKNFYSQKKEGQEPRHAYTRSETFKPTVSKLDPSSVKEHMATEGIAKIDKAFGSFPSTTTGSQASIKNLPLSPKKSFKTEISGMESKDDGIDKALMAKQNEKFKVLKESEVIKQIETQIQHKRIKKPLHTTKSLALSTQHRDSSLVNETKVSDNLSQRISVCAKEVPWDKLEFPVRPEVVLDRFSYNLAPHEREEILNYQDIYYISDLEHKLPAKAEEECDDERGDYIVIRNDQIMYRYEVLEMLGRGSFGQVVKVYDHKNQEEVAVKIIRSPKKFHHQAKIEIKVLKYMMQHKGADFNIAELKNFFVFRKHVCLVFDLMSLNLYDFLKKNKFKGFSLNVIRKFAIQILYALKFLSHHKIIHCDLKPENILLKQMNKTGVKLIDFGSSCFENEKLYTYIQSRFYRSPEVILGLSYSTQIDMWSFGCLLCELYLGYPIFAGDSEHDQLLAMIEVLGVPDLNMLMQSPKRAKFFEDDYSPKIVPNTKGKIRNPNSLSIDTILNCEDKSFVDLIKKCLAYNQNERYSASAALGHDWILKGLPDELKIQHMQLLEKANTASSTRTGFMSGKDETTAFDARENEELALYKQEKKLMDSQRGKHKKNASESIQRPDMFKTTTEKTAPSFYSKKKSGMSISHIGEEDSTGNLTITLNDSKQSLGVSKLYSNSKLGHLATPQGLGLKEKVGSLNNFFSINKSKTLSTSNKTQDTLASPKKVQTVRDGVEEAHTTNNNVFKNTHSGDFKIHKVNQRAFSHKSLSMSKKLSSPKATEAMLKVYNPETTTGTMSASRNVNFPSLKSPINNKRK